MQFLDDASIKAFADYKQQVDPKGYFNRGKLLKGFSLNDAYTPSLRLLQQEAILLEASAFGAINDSIKNCMRCGKCKPVCSTHIPRANLFYSPRDKILATGLILEAFLYEEQTRRGVSLGHFAELNDIADHCTVCHKCGSPCPVNIDFGNVSINMRNLLQDQGTRKKNLGAALAMTFLNITDPHQINIMRKVVIQWGFRAQRIAYKIYQQYFSAKQPALPPATTGHTAIKEQVIHFMRYPMPAKLPAKPARSLLGIENDKMIPILRNASKINNDSDAVFYFPGCGSERLFSQVGLATLAMLYDIGVQTVLPPGYLCCGYPQTSSGQKAKGDAISVNNRVLFHRVANTLNYLDIKTVIVSCGTCMDQLQKYQFDKIFPGCRLLDIHEYLMEKGVTMNGVDGVQYMYHDPCHTPMKTYNPLQVTKDLMGCDVIPSDHCCGDAGTLAVARPDIATQLRYQKQAVIKQDLKALTGQEKVKKGQVKMLTSCPACQKGLSSYEDATGVTTTYIVVELANKHFGDKWQQQFIKQARAGGIEQVLL